MGKRERGGGREREREEKIIRKSRQRVYATTYSLLRS